MDETATEISKLNTKLDAIEQLLEKDYEKWTLKEKQIFGNHEQLREERKQLRDKEQELLKQKTIMLQRDQNQGISSLITAAIAPVTPEQVLKDFLDFEVGTSVVIYTRPSVTLKDIPTGEITYIVPLMKFVDRQVPTEALFRSLDDYLEWKENQMGEAEKNIKFITVVGTSGKGKTTFARRFIDLPYTGKYPHIVNDCKESNRRYRVTCSDFDSTRDPETQLSLLILFEAFKYSVPKKNYRSLFAEFFENLPNSRISFERTLSIIAKTFCFESSPSIDERLLIVNLDETNELLDNDEGKQYLKKLFRILRNAAKSFSLLTILSGTHSVELFQQVKISQCKFIDIELPLIELEPAKEIILGMTTNSNSYQVSHFLEYLLKLCGGVGRYIEVAIIQMSIMGSAKMNGALTVGFNPIAYEYFLENLQTSENIENLLAQLTVGVLTHYPKVFSRYAPCIELLSCYTLFQWKVQRETIIKGLCVGDLEKEGLVFLQPIQDASDDYLCIIPFITLYWAITNSNQNVQIPFLKDIKSYFSPDESENNSLHIIMAKLWGLTQKNGLTADTSGVCTIMLSELLILRDEQPDVKIKFRPEFTIIDAPHRIDLSNYVTFKSQAKSLAFLNVKGATFTDAVVFCEPMIGIQEKQSVVAKKRIVDGIEPAKFNNKSFQAERAKFPVDDIFVLISDVKQGDIVLGKNDIFIDYENFTKFAGPLIALRKLYCINQLNPQFKRLKMK
jgi:Cdc6-like AAA superfamily ATPase